ncbi:MAG TPA: hypothetical protein VF796_21185 [Humisphaera sp.]
MTTAYGLAGFADRSAVAEALAGLVSAGMVAEGRGRRGTSYTLTDDGAARLTALPPVATPPGKGPTRAAGGRRVVPDLPENPNLLPHQQAFLLLQLLAAPGRTLTDGQANKLPKVAKEDLELTGPLAGQVRRKLADRGFLTAERAGRSLHVTLTDAGLAHLATLPHHPAGTFAVSGDALNALVATMAYWRRRLVEAAPGWTPPNEAADATDNSRPLLIGLCWAGDPRHAGDRRRSTTLAALLPLAVRAAEAHQPPVPGPRRPVALVSLKRGAGAGPWAAPPTDTAAGCRPLDLPGANDALVDTAAVVECLDLVVSVDTMVAHLVGALGVQFVVALGAGADCRWKPRDVQSAIYARARCEMLLPREEVWPGVARADRR